MTFETKTFDIAEYLTDPRGIRTFLQEVATTGDETGFIYALNTAARAMGMIEVAKGRCCQASLYKSLGEKGNPKFVTISKVTKALGCKLAIA